MGGLPMFGTLQTDDDHKECKIMKPGDVVKINGMPVTIESIEGDEVKIVWFEGDHLHRGSVSEAIASSQ